VTFLRARGYRKGIGLRFTHPKFPCAPGSVRRRCSGVAAALLRLFIGIHNAWDTVTHLVFVRKRKQHEASQTAVK
jgi:hypothetical protein